VRLHATGADAGFFLATSWLPDGQVAFAWNPGEVTLVDPENDVAQPAVHLADNAPWPGFVGRDGKGRWLLGALAQEGPILFGYEGAMRSAAEGVAPVLSPDGGWIAYLKGESLRLVRVDGSDDHEIVELAALGGRDRHFAVTPDCFPNYQEGCSYRPPVLSWSVRAGRRGR
jgi:hypothetical protein